MNMVQFKITEPDREAEGVVEIARRMRVTCLDGDRFLAAEDGLSVLDRLGIPYTIILREPFNYERHGSAARRWSRVGSAACGWIKASSWKTTS